MNWQRTLMLLLIGLWLSGCARSTVQVRWDHAFQQAMSAKDPEQLLALAKTAPRGVDEGVALHEAAYVLKRQGKALEAAKIYQAMSKTARREMDRARAHYELTRMMEAQGLLDAAKRNYRNLIMHYPHLALGDMAFNDLVRLARRESDAAVDEHLAWAREHFDYLKDYGLADNVYFLIAEEALKRAKGLPAEEAKLLESFAEYHLVQIARHGWGQGLWDDALWELSILFERQGRYYDAILAIERILREREESSFTGQNDYPYFYQGLARQARMHLIGRKDPESAAKSYLLYAKRYPMSRLRDDMRFYALCAVLQLGDKKAAQELVDTLKTEHPDSRFLAKIPSAYSDPHGEVCIPPEVL